MSSMNADLIAVVPLGGIRASQGGHASASKTKRMMAAASRSNFGNGLKNKSSHTCEQECAI